MRDKKSSVWFTAGLIITYVLMIAVNALANILPINGQTTGEISDKYGNLFAPAGFTFAVWSVIYVLLALHVLYQLGLFQKKHRSALLHPIGIYFCISSVLNAVWILAWHYEQLLLSVLIMLGMLVILIKINKLTHEYGLSRREVFFVRIPFSVYFGWITIATIANITAYLVSIDWDSFGLAEVTWTIMILLTGAAIGILAILRLKDIAYGLVLIWAYYGIYSKHISISGFHGEYPAIITTILICLALIALSIVFIAFKKIRN
ncbi:MULTISPECIES: TspO/MBR family protein [unclassified Sporosarcina]|uniref:TspO/MBR family protein n=1 Tax=unclassified Sporosarcina TaxID=2647733 RepID=UPI00203C7E11|nr:MULTISPECIES: TspO/MBR family protein [unclassified Sporosarcina]GKV64048.1 hypothetical protein NCCP2331_02010 [Sporosarcina sp. NCCP-2331]GLB56378.1 hypothetical protein NCCP2378_21650 [Sporosarcina sp. NCCP-2378]